MDTIKIRKIFGKYQILFFTFGGEFYCKIGDVEFRDTDYQMLLKKIMHSNLIIINETVYFKEMTRYERKTVVRLEYFDQRFYDEDGRQHRLEDCIPYTKENQKYLDKKQKIIDKGWNLIHNADIYVEGNLTEFKKGYWEELMNKKIKERTKENDKEVQQNVKRNTK